MRPKLYSSLAEWWPLLSLAEEYEEDAAVFTRLLSAGSRGETPPALLELGCGGGSTAWHLKRSFRMTLTDISPEMLAQSRRLNPESDHVEDDMRTLRLGRTFDCVFIHDAICYMTTIEDLRMAIGTAFVHCRPGGAALFVPDFVSETFRPSTSHGGRDGQERGLRYLEWIWDPDPSDSQYIADYAFLLREADGSMRVERDRHIAGLYGREEWQSVLRDAGFEPRVERFEPSEMEHPIEMFACIKPGR